MPPCTGLRSVTTLPNLVSLLRLLALPPLVLLSTTAQQPQATWSRWGLVLLYAGIIGTDLLDGWLARRLGQTSVLGRALDHGSDVVCILTALGAFVRLGLVPWSLPAAIAWAFALYVLDSWWRTALRPRRQLLGSRLGHLGGILYYATVGLAIGTLCTGGRWPPVEALWRWCHLLTLLALVSGTERLLLMLMDGRRRRLTDPLSDV